MARIETDARRWNIPFIEQANDRPELFECGAERSPRPCGVLEREPRGPGARTSEVPSTRDAVGDAIRRGLVVSPETCPDVRDDDFGVHGLGPTQLLRESVDRALPQGRVFGSEVDEVHRVNQERADADCFSRGREPIGVIDFDRRCPPLTRTVGEDLERLAADFKRVLQRGVVSLADGNVSSDTHPLLLSSVHPCAAQPNNGESSGYDAAMTAQAPTSWLGRAVLHVDMDAFFAAVEQLEHPEWRGRPLVVGGSPSGRGVIAAASYEARAYGVRSAMPSTQAMRLLPQDAVWVKGRHARYGEYSKRIRSVFESVSPKVQMVSIDEAFLDVTPARDDSPQPVDIARDLQARIDSMGLSCSVGVARSKTVAKIASDFDKPHGLVVVAPGEEAAFLAPLPVRALSGIGRTTAARLNALGIHTLGQLASLDETAAHHALGRYGTELVARARGVDTRPVRAEHAVKSVSNERTFPTDIAFAAPLDDALRRLAERVATRLRAGGLSGRTVTVKLRFTDFTTRSAQCTVPVPILLEEDILPLARELLASLWHEGVGVRLLGVAVSGFGDAAEQLDLFSPSAEAESLLSHRLAESIDAVRRRFGDEAIGRGVDADLRGTLDDDDVTGSGGDR